MVSVNQSTVNDDWAQTRFRWAGLGWPGPNTCRATGLAMWRTWASVGLRSTGTAHGGWQDKGPWTIGRVFGGPRPPFLSLSWLTVHWAYRTGHVHRTAHRQQGWSTALDSGLLGSFDLLGSSYASVDMVGHSGQCLCLQQGPTVASSGEAHLGGTVVVRRAT